MTIKRDYERGVRIRFGSKIDQIYTVRWNPERLQFLCSCPAGFIRGEICWHRDIVVTKLAELALDRMPEVVTEMEADNIMSSASSKKRKLLFD